MNKELAICFYFQSSWMLLINLQKFPRFGELVFIVATIGRTVLKFFFALLPLIISYAVAFHILLIDAPSFETVGDSFIKVVAMTTGELDMTTSVIANNGNWFNKVIFGVFIMMMSVIAMNMILGLAINDITEIR